MRWIMQGCRLVAATGLLALAGCQPVMAPPAAREVTVLAGAGLDVVAVNAFFPESIRIRVGDTLVWKINSDEPHTATFTSGEPLPPDLVPIPGGGPTDLMLNPALAFPSRAPDAPVETYSGTGFRASGFLSTGKVVPPADLYALTFDTPGTYEYVCQIHPTTMFGEVVVEPASTASVPTQEEIDAQAEAEIAPLLAMAEELRTQTTNSEMVRSEAGPDGSTIWHVPAGMSGKDPRIEIYDYFPKDLTIQSGDTVIWTSLFFHQVIFSPGQPVPPFAYPIEQEAGPPYLAVTPEVLFPVKPSGEFDGVSLYSSGLIGTLNGPLPGGTTFALKFNDPGVFDYACSTHDPLGMRGTLTVVE